MYDRAKTQRTRAQSTLFVAGVLTVIMIVAVAVSVFGFGEPENPEDTQTSTEIPTQTDIPSPTESRLSTPTRTQAMTVIATPTATATPTTIPANTPTATVTLDPAANERYSEFVATVYGETEVDADIPVRTSGWRVLDNKVLVVVMNLTAPSEDEIRRVKQVNTLVTSGYSQAVAHYDNGKIGGDIPNQLRIAELNNTGSPPKTLYVNTSLVREYYSGQLTAMEFTDQYWSTETNMTDAQIEYVYDMSNSAGNSTLYNGDEE
ncbi:hypothetical protein [Halosimplex sp. J119]